MKVNRTKLAKLLGVSLPTVDAWLASGLPYISKPDKEAGTGWEFDVTAVIKWREESIEANVKKRVRSLGLEESKQRKLSAEAQKAELELSIMEEEYIPVKDVQLAATTIYNRAKQLFQSLPAMTANQLSGMSDPKEIRNLLSGHINGILNDMADFQVEDEEEGEEEV